MYSEKLGSHKFSKLEHGNVYESIKSISYIKIPQEI